MPDPGTAPPSAAVVNEAIKPYKIHIPNKYLEQVKKKLELTRLPHEGSEPKSDSWWEPKPLVEPLIDFWLDKYNWRDQENILNDTLPQYRTAITLPLLASALRIHFIHVRSPHENAIPLLLIPPFPFTNLSFSHLIKPLTDPSDPTALNQPFHLVIPSLPGLGFSDALPNNLAPIPATAEIFDSLMRRLSYPKYLVSGASPGHVSPAEIIDFKLINHLSTRYTSSCIGAHFISPPLEAPRLNDHPWEYLKWKVANFFHAEILGYTVEDFQALDRIYRRPGVTVSTSPTKPNVSEAGFDEPNTLAYALCDSPSGMLAFVLKALLELRPDEKSRFSQDQLVTLTNLAWLPGPEYAMRFWAHCKRHEEEVLSIREDGKGKKSTAARKKPYVSITVFVGDDRTMKMTTTTKTGEPDTDIASTEAGKGKVEEKARRPLGDCGILLAPISEQPGGILLTEAENSIEPATSSTARKSGKVPTEWYICPAWANGRYNVIHTQRGNGKAGGLLAFERPDVVIDGIRGLAKGLMSLPDNPFKTPPSLTEKGTVPLAKPEQRGGVKTAPLEAVLVVPAGSAPTTGLTAPALPTTITRTTIPPTVPGFGKKLPTLDEEKTSPNVDKGKGKEKEIDASPSPVRPAASPRPTGSLNPGTAAAATTDGLLSPPQLPRDHSFGDGSSPDTLVEGQVGKKKVTGADAGAGNNSPSPLLRDNITLVSPSQDPSPVRPRSPLRVPSAGASPGPAPATEGGDK